MNVRLLLLITCLQIHFPDCLLASNEFLETFNGTHSATNSITLSGFDNPDWSYGWIGHDSAMITEGQFVVTNSTKAGEEELSQLWRESSYSGSFREYIQLSAVDLGNYTSDSASPGTSNHISIRHLFYDTAGRARGYIQISLSEFIAAAFEDDNSNLVFCSRTLITFNNQEQCKLLPKPSDGHSIEMGFEFIAEESTIVAWIDDDHATDERVETYHSVELPTIITSARSILRVAAADGAIANASVDQWQYDLISEVLVGDFDRNGILDISDVDLLLNGVLHQDIRLDLDDNAFVDIRDLKFWLHELFQTYFGDSNLDGQFNSADLVNVFVAGEYEDAIVGNSTWATGDWSGNGEFDSADLVLAFQDGGYELGPREAVSSVPEPNESGVGVSFGFLISWLVRRRQSLSDVPPVV